MEEDGGRNGQKMRECTVRKRHWPGHVSVAGAEMMMGGWRGKERILINRALPSRIRNTPDVESDGNELKFSSRRVSISDLSSESLLWMPWRMNLGVETRARKPLSKEAVMSTKRQSVGLKHNGGRVLSG